MKKTKKILQTRHDRTKKARKILFLGTHGVGKSTAALAKASEMKNLYRSLSVKVIEENVREILNMVGGKLNSQDFQLLCFVDHLRKELVFEKLYDVLVCDRTCFDTLVYGLAYGIPLPPEYFTLALRHLDSFKEIYFYRPKSYEDPVKEDGFRDTDVETRNKVDQLFEDLLKLWGGRYTEVRI